MPIPDPYDMRRERSVAWQELLEDFYRSGCDYARVEVAERSDSSVASSLSHAVDKFRGQGRQLIVPVTVHGRPYLMRTG